MSAGQAWNNARRVLLVDVNNNALVTQLGDADHQPATDRGLITNARLYGYNGADWNRVQTGAGRLQASIMPAVGVSDGGTAGLLADASGGNRVLANAPNLYNGATWDRLRGNVEGTLLASAARTATTDSTIQTNHNAKGVLLFLNVSAWGGAGSLTVSVRGVDPVSAVAKTIATFTAVTAADLFPLSFFPGATAGASQAIAGVLPRSWWVRVTAADGTSHTYSLGYSLIV